MSQPPQGPGTPPDPEEVPQQPHEETLVDRQLSAVVPEHERQVF